MQVYSPDSDRDLQFRSGYKASLFEGGVAVMAMDLTECMGENLSGVTSSTFDEQVLDAMCCG